MVQSLRWSSGLQRPVDAGGAQRNFRTTGIAHMVVRFLLWSTIGTIVSTGVLTGLGYMLVHGSVKWTSGYSRCRLQSLHLRLCLSVPAVSR